MSCLGGKMAVLHFRGYTEEAFKRQKKKKNMEKKSNKTDRDETSLSR